MKSWASPDLPRLPGRGLPLALHDSTTRTVRPTAPGEVATLYTCGVTPYDATHLGHASTYLASDLVQRVWADAGHEVRAVQNVSDVDDPLLERARRDGVAWEDLAERETRLFCEDMEALRCLAPSSYVGVTEVVDDVAALVARCTDAGLTYDLDGDVYLDVARVPHFGALAALGREEMLALTAEHGGDPGREGKRDPLDSLLWRAERDGEPAWDSVVGRGRPGWHVECAQIALDGLGETFDVLLGGSDLLFPHHEHSCATTTAATGAWPVARLVAHAGLVGLDGEKMSKSKGNLVFVHRLREQADPMAVRLAVLGHHYRSSWSWTDEDLAAAARRLGRWREAVAVGAGGPADALRQAVREALADDLRTPRALDAVDSWADETLRRRGGSDPDAGAEVAAAVDALLGVAL